MCCSKRMRMRIRDTVLESHRRLDKTMFGGENSVKACHFVSCKYNEQYHQKLKHSSNFDKKQRLKTNVFVNKTIYSAYTCKKPFSK